ncbi:MAG: glycosyltransferase [Deltaproteobacteria bacterium]|nr:glycosyltransferase [Deltaproteobacteria bacterium]
MFGILRYLLGAFFAIAAAVLPRKALEQKLQQRMRDAFYPSCAFFLFFKSGRAALAAVFEGVAREQPGAVVLVPDYICNVVDCAAAGCDMRLVRYRTDAHFHADLDDIEQKLKAHRAAALVLASLFGCQNRTSAVLDRIRARDRRLLLIIDDCQNLVTGMPFYPDDRTVIVFSFNMKHVPGSMGGGVCATGHQIRVLRPERHFLHDALLEVWVFGRLMRQVQRTLRQFISLLFRRAVLYNGPELEFSDCRGVLYDPRMQRIARLSVVRALQGLGLLKTLEAQRRKKFMRLSALLEEKNWGNPVCTENVQVSPLVAIDGLYQGLIGRLPLKGPYAKHEDPSSSFRPALLVCCNDGFSFSALNPVVVEAGAVGADPAMKKELVLNNQTPPLSFRVRVCHLTTAHRALDNRIFDKEALSLARAGYEVTIIGQHDREEVCNGVRLVPIPKPVGRLERLQTALFGLAGLAKRQKADVYHFHDPELIPLGLFLKLFGKKVIYDAHEDYAQTLLTVAGLPPALRRLLSFIWDGFERMAARVFDGIIVVDSNIRRKFCAYKTEMITNVPPLAFSRSHSRPQRSGPLKLIYTGVVAAERGIVKIVQALNLMQSRDVELHIIGTVDDAEFQKLFDADPRIICHGRLPWRQALQEIELGDVGLMLFQPVPAHMFFTGEGNTKLFEFMGFGMPVLYGNLPNLSKFFGPLNAGLAVDPTSPEEIAAAIDRLHDDSELCQYLGENGRRAVRERFHWEAEEKKFLVFYDRVFFGKKL